MSQQYLIKCIAHQSTESCENSYLPLQRPFLKWYEIHTNKLKRNIGVGVVLQHSEVEFIQHNYIFWLTFTSTTGTHNKNFPFKKASFYQTTA